MNQSTAANEGQASAPGPAASHSFPTPQRPGEPPAPAQPGAPPAGQPMPAAPLPPPAVPSGATPAAAPPTPTPGFEAAGVPEQIPEAPSATSGSVSPAAPGHAKQASGVRALFGTAVTLGPVLVVALVTLAFVGLLFAVLHARIGEVESSTQTGLEHTRKELSSNIADVDKKLGAIKTNLATMQSRLPNAGTQRRIDAMAASVAAIEKQINAWAAQEEDTEAENKTTKKARAR